MKVEEAIKHLEIVRQCRREMFVRKGKISAGKEDEEVFTMAISALEKQVAKKPQTNADRIRAMSDEELADFLDNVFNNIFDEYEFPCEFCTERINCDVCFVEWLKKEVEDE